VLVLLFIKNNKNKVLINGKKITLVGAGVISAAITLTLQKNGHNVLLLDREQPCSGTSFTKFFNAIKILNQSNSLLAIRPAYLHCIFQ